MLNLLTFKKISVFLAGIFLFVGIGGYLLFGDQLRNASSNHDEAEVRVGVANAGGEFSSAVIVAYERGYFLEEGLNVNLTKERSGVSALEKMQVGELDIVTASDFAFVNNSFVNPSARIIATIDSADAVEVIARRDAGITLPTDLKGKRIGVVPQTAANYVLGRFLNMNGTSFSDIEIIEFTYAEAKGMIEDGFVDALIINNPHAYDISNSLGENGISWPAQYGQKLLFNAVSNNSFISSRPQAVEGFLRALVKAERYINLQPNEAKSIVMESFSFTENYVNKQWSNHDFSIRLDQVLLPTLEAQARWLLLYDETKGTAIPNYLPRVYIDGLHVVAPESVTIIR